MESIAEYNINVHLFGAKSSPSVANYALQTTAVDFAWKYPKAVCQMVLDNFYVDDGLLAFENEEDANNSMKDLVSLCNEAGFKLNKFNGNKCIARIFTADVEKENKDVKTSFETSPKAVLGIEWDISTDSFVIKAKNEIKEYTRRGILSVVAGIYDPLGFVSPFVLVGKLLVQQLFRETKSWDSPLSSELQTNFSLWYNQIEVLKTLKVPRCIVAFGKQLENAELHHFSDASSKGYGCVSYLRYIAKGRICTRFLHSKARCAPLKEVTIPRLELVAALLSTECDQMLRKELRLKVTKSVFWSDSRSVLLYIQNDAKRFQTFVANRIQKIRDVTEPKQWRYVPSKLNPADLPSRGVNAQDLINSNLWFDGPNFLVTTEDKYPKQIPLTGGQDALELRKPVHQP